MSAPRHRNKPLTVAFLSLLLFAVSCVDAPYAPEDGFVPGPLVLAPSLTLVGPNGAPAATEAQADALTEAFDLVDRFRMVVRRATNNALVVDTIIQVTPGQESYDLSASVTTTSPDEQFLVSFTAFQGQTELFSSPPMSVKATPENSSNNSPPAPINVTLTYSGPGATASAVEVEPAVVVVGPEGSATFNATVLDEEGNALSGVPVSWTSGSEGVATVADGTVTGQADGITTIVVTTPTGLQATASVYVVSGSLAYVEGGQVFVRAAGGGDAEAHTPSNGASAPAWTADGGQLYYAAEGSARLAGIDEPIVQGDWPAASPNGAYLAVDQGGQVVFANADGSAEREGPAGTTPVWSDDGTLIVGGGSIQQVDVSGSGRATLVTGDAQLPALGPAGAVAYVSGGELMVTGRTGSVAGAVSGRPSWSAGGNWLAFGGAEGIMIVPADGSAPPTPLPGLAAATDPAWQPSSPMAAPSSPSLSGLDPDPPIPGQAVSILGSGFDRVIPSNNQVFWPTPSGPEETEVSGVQSGSLSTVMPRSVSAGQIRVENRAGTAVLDFVPSLGALEVAAMTPWGTGVPGIAVVLIDASGQEAARGETDSDGMLLLAGLQPGTYTVQLTPPNNYVFQQARTRAVDIGTETVLMELVLSPLVARVQSDPEVPVLAVGEQVAVGITAYDAAGNVIPQFETARWGRVTHHLGVGGSGLTGTIAGAAPTAQEGGAQYSVALNGQVFILTATVTSRIEGSVTRTTEEGSEPARSYALGLEKDGVEVAKSHTDGSGQYFFDGLLGGEYTVRPAEPAEGSVNPASQTVTLDAGSPEGKADFVISSVEYAHDFRVLIFSGGHTNNNVGILQEFEARYPDLTFETAWGSAPDASYLATFSMVFLYENGVFSASKSVGDALGAYIDSGGNIVIGTFYWQDRSDAGWNSEGWGTLESLDPFIACRTGPPCPGNGGSEYNYSALDPASIVPHPLTLDVTSLWVDAYHGGVTAKEGTTVVAKWDDGIPLIGYRIGPKGQRIVAVSMFPGYADYSSGFGGDFYQVWENAIRWAAAGSIPSAALAAPAAASKLRLSSSLNLSRLEVTKIGEVKPSGTRGR